jgi:hypothetical protein
MTLHKRSILVAGVPDLKPDSTPLAVSFRALTPFLERGGRIDVSHRGAATLLAIGRILKERVQRQIAGVTGLVAPSITRSSSSVGRGTRSLSPGGKDLRQVTVCRRRGWLRRNEPGQACASFSS